MATPDIQGPEERMDEFVVPPMDADEKDKRLLKRAKKLFEDARQDRDEVAQHWPRYYRLWATDQWHDIHVDEWRSQPQINLIFSTIELEAATMTDQDPQLVVFPRRNEEESLVIADILNKIFTNTWRISKGKLVLKNAVRNSKIFGTGILKTAWSEEKDDASILSVPPDQFYPDPSATGDEDMWYCFQVYDVSVNDIIQNWPDKARQVKVGRRTDLGQFERDVWSSEGNDGLEGTTGRLTFTEGDSTHTTLVKFGTGEAGEAMRGVVTLMEFWEKDPKTGETTLHYIAGDVILDSIKNPLGKKIRRFPYVRIPNIPIDGEYWGISAVQPLEPIQLSINKRRQQIIDNLRILGNPPILADKGAGLEEDLILGAPGEIISINDGARVNWLNPPAMPQGIFQLQQLDKSEFETVSGMFDVVQGRTPSGIEAAAAIAELQEAAQVRIRDKVAVLESALEELGGLVLHLIQSNYTERKALLIQGKEGALERIDINVPIVSLDQAQDMFDEEMEKGLELENVERALDITKGEFLVEVKAGSTLPLSKSARLNEAMMLFDRGLVDQQEVLTTILHPRRREIMERMAQAAGGGQPQGLEALLGGVSGGLGGGEPSLGGAEQQPIEENLPPGAPQQGIF